MKSKRLTWALITGLLVVGCGTMPTGTAPAPQLSPEQAKVLESTAVSDRYRVKATELGLEAEATAAAQLEVGEEASRLAVTNVEASSVRSDTWFPVAHLTDGNLRSAWGPAPGDDSPTLIFTFRECASLEAMAIKLSGGVTFDVAVPDGDGWRTIASDLDAEDATLDWLELDGTEASEVRLTFSGDTADLLVCEVQWFGAACAGGGGGTTPTPAPSVTPTPAPSEVPSETPSETPSESPSVTPTATPTVTPTATPTPAPSLTPPPMSNVDCCKVTGGGQVPSPAAEVDSNNPFVSFGFNAQEDPDRGAKGQLQVNDHVTGDRWHVDVTDIVRCDHETGLVEFVGELKLTNTGTDVGATARVIVVDDGEPGTEDTFTFWVDGILVADGDLKGDRPGGGNIQFHEPNCD